MRSMTMLKNLDPSIQNHRSLILAEPRFDRKDVGHDFVRIEKKLADSRNIQTYMIFQLPKNGVPYHLDFEEVQDVLLLQGRQVRAVLQTVVDDNRTSSTSADAATFDCPHCTVIAKKDGQADLCLGTGTFARSLSSTLRRPRSRTSRWAVPREATPSTTV